jgi:trehalose 6-phosphate phosphatase
VCEQITSVNGALVEPKKSSVAVHYRLVDEHERPRIKPIVDAAVAAHPHALRLMPGKMVYEIQPKLDWDKGRAVLYLLEALRLDGEDVMPLYVGDDITDEHAFRALSGRGIGILVADPADPEIAGRSNAADCVLRDTQEVERFLDGLAR